MILNIYSRLRLINMVTLVPEYSGTCLIRHLYNPEFSGSDKISTQMSVLLCILTLQIRQFGKPTHFSSPNECRIRQVPMYLDPINVVAPELKVKLTINPISIISESGIFLFIPFTPGQGKDMKSFPSSQPS